MLSAGLQIPIPLEHQPGADPAAALAGSVAYNAGFVGDYDLDHDGTLWGGLDIEAIPDPAGGAGISDPEAIAHRLANTIKFVSPSIVPGWRDGTGRAWDGITHVCLTPIPVWHAQQPFGTPFNGAGVASPALSMSLASWRDGAIQLSIPAGEWALQGPYQGQRGGQYWLNQSGQKVYKAPGQGQQGQRQPQQGQQQAPKQSGQAQQPMRQSKPAPAKQKQPAQAKPQAAKPAAATPTNAQAAPKPPAPNPAANPGYAAASVRAQIAQGKQAAALKTASKPAAPIAKYLGPDKPALKPEDVPGPGEYGHSKRPNAAPAQPAQAAPKDGINRDPEHHRQLQHLIDHYKKGIIPQQFGGLHQRLRKRESITPSKLPHAPSKDHPEDFHEGWVRGMMQKAYKRGHRNAGDTHKAAHIALRVMRTGKTGKALAEHMNAMLGKHFPVKDEAKTASDRSRHAKLSMAQLSLWMDQHLVPLDFILMAAQHAPAGGITFAGKHYRGGQFIPNSEVEKASPADKRKLTNAKKAAREKLKAGGPVDHAGLAEKVASHKADLSPKDLTSAKRTFGQLMDHHEDAALHRIQQLIEKDTKKLESLGDQDPVYDQTKRRLAAYGHMLEWAKGHEKLKSGEGATEPEAELVSDENDIHAKSEGHAAFVGDWEYYHGPDGDLYRAKRDSPIMTDGRRFGRWDMPPHMAEKALKQYQEQDAKHASQPEAVPSNQGNFFSPFKDANVSQRKMFDDTPEPEKPASEKDREDLPGQQMLPGTETKAPEAAREAILDAANAIKDRESRYGGIVKVPDLFDEAKKAHPGLTRKQFDEHLHDMQASDELVLQVVNDPGVEPRRDEMIRSERGLLGYVQPTGRSARKADKPHTGHWSEAPDVPFEKEQEAVGDSAPTLKAAKASKKSKEPVDHKAVASNVRTLQKALVAQQKAANKTKATGPSVEQVRQQIRNAVGNGDPREVAKEYWAIRNQDLGHAPGKAPRFSSKTAALKFLEDTAVDSVGSMARVEASLADLPPAQLSRQTRPLLQTQTLLSHKGAENMAKKPGSQDDRDDDRNAKPAAPDADDSADDDLFDDSDLEDGDGSGLDLDNMPNGQTDPEPEGEPEPTASEFAAILEGEGLIVPAAHDMDLREYIRHLMTSLASKKHHEAKTSGAGTDPNNPNGGDPNMATQGGTPTPEQNQNQFTMMSRQLDTLKRENAELKTAEAGRRLKEVQADFSLAVKAQLIDQADVDKHLAVLNTKQLSLVQKDDSDVSRLAFLSKTLGDVARRQLKAKGLLDDQVDLSKAEGVVRPNGQWGEVNITDEKAEEAADYLVGKRKAKAKA